MVQRGSQYTDLGDWEIVEESREDLTPPVSLGITDVITDGPMMGSRRGSSELPSSLLRLEVLPTPRELCSRRLV